MTSGSRPIESLLLELGDQIIWPEHGDQTPVVLGRLSSRGRASRHLRWVPVTIAILLVAASILLLSPGAREAVADLLGVAGIEVQFASDTQPPVGAELDLGEAVTLEEAVAAVQFDVWALDLPGPPDAVYLSARPSGGRVSMVWRGDKSLPAAGETDIGLIHSQFALRLGEDLVFIKSVTPDNVVRAVEVNGVLGIWIAGAPHLITYEDAAGVIHEEETRLAGNVLMWERAGVTHRIETTLPLAPAVELAESLITPG
jgi:hypothetical protein